jgi:predicted alpha/beta-fold hydrolase
MTSSRSSVTNASEGMESNRAGGMRRAESGPMSPKDKTESKTDLTMLLKESSCQSKIPLLEDFARRSARRSFIAPPPLRNGHLMTIIGTQRPRKFSIGAQACERREFQTEPGTRVVAYCHWQSVRTEHPTALIIHGLEGSSEGSYVRGVASKAFDAGFNVLRYNVRGCGGTNHLSPTLYHSGLTVDLHYVMRELIEAEQLPELFLIGFSMGGNQALKFAGELRQCAPRELKGVCAISPPICLESCSRAIARRENWIYEYRFIRSLRKTMIEKVRLFPGSYDISRMHDVRHLWDWDEMFQPYNGFSGARDYYSRASSLPFIDAIRVPTLILHAEDDPFIPFTPFTDARIAENSMVLLISSKHGGHVAFCGGRQADEDRAWAENRAVEFSRAFSRIA